MALYMAQRIEDAPSIDIVRCSECTERDDDWCMYWGNVINADDFCSYGEREGEMKEVIVRYTDGIGYENVLGEVVGELVRCKECKWYKQSESFCENGNGLWQAGDDCFCSYGEREDE